jgi:hydroxysqualene synthase
MRAENSSLATPGRTAAQRATPARDRPQTLHEAQAACARVATRHYENFPVASFFLPRAGRDALRAVYAFARAADDFADEPEHEGVRLERLAEWERLLRQAFAGETEHPVFVALGDAARRHALSIDPFLDLLEAFRMDARETQYANWESLLGYCRLSANPVGRIVLRVFGQDDPETVALSDAVCTGLQLANHWQDLGIDTGRGRHYVPREALERHGVTGVALAAGVVDERLRALMGELIDRARERFLAGRPIGDRVAGRLRLQIRLTWHGGWRVLDRIEAAGGDVFRRRPRLGARDACIVGWRALAWRS